MSDSEKDRQIGALMRQRQEQKTLLEHLKLKSKSIAAAYSSFSYNQERWCVDPSIEGVFLRHPKMEERAHPTFLLNQSELAIHLRELATAEQDYLQTVSQLRSLGITE